VEIFGTAGRSNIIFGTRRLSAYGTKPANGGLRGDIVGKISGDRTGWLGWQDSNCEMAASSAANL
jgi:hypothetical protein